MYKGRGERKETTPRPSLGCHLDVWEVLPVVLEATADEEGPKKGPVKGFIGVIGVLKCVFRIAGDSYWRNQVD